jgi:hypothetical protein
VPVLPLFSEVYVFVEIYNSAALSPTPTRPVINRFPSPHPCFIHPKAAVETFTLGICGKVRHDQILG